MKLSEIVSQIGGTLDVDRPIEIRGVADIREAKEGEISFIANSKYASEAAVTKASAVLVAEDWNKNCSAPVIRVENPDAAFAQVAALFYTPAPLPPEGVHPSAVVAEDVDLGDGVRIGPFCVIEAGAKIGARTLISAQCYIGHQVCMGEDNRIYPQVSIRESVTIGNRTIIHNGTVVGSDGFGYSVDQEGVRTKIPQIGTVQIGDDVEIGSNVTVDRARFGTTKIGHGVKIDNLVQIAHNVTIGDHAVIVAQVGLAGSSHVGEKVVIAGQVGVAGHIKIGDGAIVGARSVVLKDIPSGEYVLGTPAMPALKFKQMQASTRLLPTLRKRILALEKEVALLQEKE